MKLDILYTSKIKVNMGAFTDIQCTVRRKNKPQPIIYLRLLFVVFSLKFASIPLTL